MCSFVKVSSFYAPPLLVFFFAAISVSSVFFVYLNGCVCVWLRFACSVVGAPLRSLAALDSTR